MLSKDQNWDLSAHKINSHELFKAYYRCGFIYVDNVVLTNYLHPGLNAAFDFQIIAILKQVRNLYSNILTLDGDIE